MEYPSPPPQVKCTASMFFCTAVLSKTRFSASKDLNTNNSANIRLHFSPSIRKETIHMLLNEISCCALNFGASESLKAILTSLPQAFFHTKRKVHVFIDHPQFVNSSNILWTLRFPNHKLGYSYMITSFTWLHEGQVCTCCNFWINWKTEAVGGKLVPRVLSLHREKKRGPWDPITRDRYNIFS